MYGAPPAPEKPVVEDEAEEEKVPKPKPKRGRPPKSNGKSRVVDDDDDDLADICERMEWMSCGSGSS